MPFSLTWIMLRRSYSHWTNPPIPNLQPQKSSVSPLCRIQHSVNLSAPNVGEHKTSISVHNLTIWLLQDTKWCIILFISSPHFWDEFVQTCFCIKLFILPHLYLTIREFSIKTVEFATAVSLKSCTSCTDLAKLATTISRKINYDVTQSRPEGAARLHTPKTCSTLSSLTTQNKNWETEQERRGGEKGQDKEGNEGIFSFSYIHDSNIPPASFWWKFSHWSRSSTGNSLVWNSMADGQTCTCAYLCTYTQRHTHATRQTTTHTHQINTVCICSRSTNTATRGVSDENLAVVPPLPKSQNTTEVCLWVREGIGSLSKHPYT